MQKIFSWGGGKIIEIELPGFEDWVPELFEQFEKSRSTAKKSHKIGGRWENLYIDIDVGSPRASRNFASAKSQSFLCECVILFSVD